MYIQPCSRIQDLFIDDHLTTAFEGPEVSLVELSVTRWFSTWKFNSYLAIIIVKNHKCKFLSPEISSEKQQLEFYEVCNQ